MSTRYLTNAAIALLGGFVVVISMGLASTTAIGWVAFGVAIGVVGILALAQLDTKRGLTQRLLDGALTAVGGTLIAVSVVFAGTTVMWLAFALALGLVGVAFAGLTLHEISTWRAMHRLGRLRWLGPEAVSQGEATAGPRAA